MKICNKSTRTHGYKYKYNLEFNLIIEILGHMTYRLFELRQKQCIYRKCRHGSELSRQSSVTKLNDITEYNLKGFHTSLQLPHPKNEKLSFSFAAAKLLVLSFGILYLRICVLCLCSRAECVNFLLQTHKLTGLHAHLVRVPGLHAHLV